MKRNPSIFFASMGLAGDFLVILYSSNIMLELWIQDLDIVNLYLKILIYKISNYTFDRTYIASTVDLSLV